MHRKRIAVIMIMFKYYQLLGKKCDFTTIVNHLTTDEYFISLKFRSKRQFVGHISNEVATYFSIVCQRNSSYHNVSRKTHSLET